MHYRKIIDSLTKPEKKAYTPAFSIKEEQYGWRVFDGEKDIAKFYHNCLDIWSFSPFEDDIKANVRPPGKVIDLHTHHNTTINFGTQGWPKHWMENSTEEELIRWNWLKADGDTLQALIKVDGPEDETGRWLLTLAYDPERHQYTLNCSIKVRKMDPDGMEAFNMMTAGALQARAENRRWTHSVWDNPDGECRRIVHSNALFQATDYGGARDGGGPWRFRHLPYPQAWIGYAAHHQFNPVVLIHKTNVPSGIATCSQLFDEHIIWSRAGQDNIDENGYFAFDMEVELVNMPADLAKEILDKAKDPMKPKKWHHYETSLPLYFDIVNDLETPVDPWAPEDCPILTIPKNSEQIQYVEGVSHSGKHAIQFTGARFHGRVTLHPSGAVCNVEPNSRYRFSAWIKTENADRYARLTLQTYEYNYINVIDSAHSGKVSGTSDWTQVQVELDTHDEAYVMPKLELYGTGNAWFDDLQLIKVD